MIAAPNQFMIRLTSLQMPPLFCLGVPRDSLFQRSITANSISLREFGHIQKGTFDIAESTIFETYRHLRQIEMPPHHFEHVESRVSLSRADIKGVIPGRRIEDSGDRLR